MRLVVPRLFSHQEMSMDESANKVKRGSTVNELLTTFPFLDKGGAKTLARR